MYQRESPPELLRPRVRLFEELGLDDVWIVEDMGFAGGIAMAATALEASSRINVGIGILPAVVRNPLYAAMELAALARLHPSRLIPGIGHGMQGWMEQVGAVPASPLRALQEVLTSVRTLLGGSPLDMTETYVKVAGVRLEFPPQQKLPVLAGVRGVRSLRLAGQIADGIILAEPVSPSYVRWSRAVAAAAAAESGREPPIVVAYSRLSVDHHPGLASTRMRSLLASKPGGLSEPSARSSLRTLDFATELERAIDSARSEDQLAAALLPDWIDELSVSGTPADCARSIARLAAAGADRIVLVPTLDRIDEEARIVGEEILPLLL
jgi:alkanesulfonate monooxygenase SsuD/methylene tetrahydromethanopterin reductase-like flavin-dependent oxidoreductase (luciferase family)